MNRVTRLLALAGVGLGVAASVAVGTAPAQAAGQSGTHSATVQAKANWGHDDYRLVDTFRSPIGCARVGRMGEFAGRWDDWACFPVRYGFRHGAWALVASDDDDCDWGSYRDRRFFVDRPYFGDRRGSIRNFR